MKRMTKQREAILRHLSEKKRPLSIEELLAFVAEELPSINLSTIYRNLKGMVEEGKIAIVDVPKEKPRYELIGTGHHHHFRCDRCNKVFNIHNCPGGLQNMIPPGFLLLGHSITLNGLCINCL